ncbi:four helix bundle protein [Christiangramia forsetii]|uniref:four helix bundle protein n=1 Tax=Christiangramia forsetii TaxID=411153 RepID=UPI001E5C0A38|nr:four helix bundle protein [Christiangramia forsetii]
MEIWKQSRVFCKDIYIVIANFPKSEKFGLISQLRRASVSIPSNISEGTSRISSKDFSRYLEMAMGSCYEVETQILLSNDLGFLKDTELIALQEKLTSIIKMISKFRSTINARIKN